MSEWGGMTLNEIRNLDYADAEVHLRIAIAKDEADKEFQMNIHGIPTGEAAKKVKRAKRTKGGGATKEVMSENISISETLSDEEMVNILAQHLQGEIQ